MTEWRIRALPDCRLAEAWPLVHLRYPDWTMDTWLAEARTLLAEEGAGGILAAETNAGYIYAVCGYQMDPCDGSGTALDVRIVANVGWRGTADPLASLLKVVEGVARDHGFARIRVDGSSVAAVGETARWEGLGYSWMGLDLCKELDPVGRAVHPQH